MPNSNKSETAGNIFHPISGNRKRFPSRRGSFKWGPAWPSTEKLIPEALVRGTAFLPSSCQQTPRCRSGAHLNPRSDRWGLFFRDPALCLCRPGQASPGSPPDARFRPQLPWQPCEARMGPKSGALEQAFPKSGSSHPSPAAALWAPRDSAGLAGARVRHQQTPASVPRCQGVPWKCGCLREVPILCRIALTSGRRRLRCQARTRALGWAEHPCRLDSPPMAARPAEAEWHHIHFATPAPPYQAA